MKSPARKSLNVAAFIALTSAAITAAQAQTTITFTGNNNAEGPTAYGQYVQPNFFNMSYVDFGNIRFTTPSAFPTGFVAPATNTPSFAQHGGFLMANQSNSFITVEADLNGDGFYGTPADAFTINSFKLLGTAVNESVSYSLFGQGVDSNNQFINFGTFASGSITSTGSIGSTFYNAANLPSDKFTSLTYSYSGISPMGIDNFTYSTGAIPEPSSFAVIGSIAALTTAVTRRRKA